MLAGVVNINIESQLGIEIQLFLPTKTPQAARETTSVPCRGTGQPRQLLSGHLASESAVARGLAGSKDMQELSCREPEKYPF